MSTTQNSAGLGPGRPSRTSIMVAAGRALGAREPDPSVRNPDYLAERFLGSAERELIRDSPFAAALEQDYLEARRDPEVVGLANFMLVRTRFIDDRLALALANGATQVVALGAGFDTRAYRFERQLTGKTFFEVDFHSTQEYKKRRVQEVLGGLPPHVVFAEIDFKHDKLAEVLRAAGYRRGEKTFFIWEGVSMYLAESAVRETLQTVSTLAPAGSSLVMDFAGRIMIDLMAKYPNGPTHRFTSGWGEPWLFGVPDNREREFFQECGLAVREILGYREASKLYLTRADGTKLGRPRGKSARRAPSAMSGMGKVEFFKMAAHFVWTLLTVRSKWWAMAELVVPDA